MKSKYVYFANEAAIAILENPDLDDEAKYEQLQKLYDTEDYEYGILYYYISSLVIATGNSENLLSLMQSRDKIPYNDDLILCLYIRNDLALFTKYYETQIIPISDLCITSSCLDHSLEIARFLHSKGHPTDKDLYSTLMRIKMNKDKFSAIFQFLQDIHYASETAVTLYHKRYSPETVRFCAENGIKISAYTLKDMLEKNPEIYEDLFRELNLLDDFRSKRSYADLTLEEKIDHIASGKINVRDAFIKDISNRNIESVRKVYETFKDDIRLEDYVANVLNTPNLDLDLIRYFKSLGVKMSFSRPPKVSYYDEAPRIYYSYNIFGYPSDEGYNIWTQLHEEGLIEWCQEEQDNLRYLRQHRWMKYFRTHGPCNVERLVERTGSAL